MLVKVFCLIPCGGR